MYRQPQTIQREKGEQWLCQDPTRETCSSRGSFVLMAIQICNTAVDMMCVCEDTHLWWFERKWEWHC